MLGTYYRWFVIDKKILNAEMMDEKLNIDIRKSCWIDALHHQVRIRAKALNEVLDHLEKRNRDGEIVEESDQQLFRLLKVLNNNWPPSRNTRLSDADKTLLAFAEKELLYVDKEDHLPIPVFSKVLPSVGNQFILHLMLRCGRFETEVDLTLHASLRECLRYAKLIGNDNDYDSLITYTNDLMYVYIMEEVIEYSYSYETIGKLIVEAYRLLFEIIVHDHMPISDMPQTSLQAINEKQAKELEEYWKSSKEELIKTAYHELGK